MKMQSFEEWLNQKDPELMNELNWKKYAMGGALAAGGLAAGLGWNSLKSKQAAPTAPTTQSAPAQAPQAPAKKGLQQIKWVDGEETPSAPSAPSSGSGSGGYGGSGTGKKVVFDD